MMTTNKRSKKHAIEEISGMVSSLRTESDSHPSWCECIREVRRKTPNKWTKSNGIEISTYKDAYRTLFDQYERIDFLEEQKNNKRI